MNRKHAVIALGLAVAGCGSIPPSAEGSTSTTDRAAPDSTAGQDSAVSTVPQGPAEPVRTRWEYHVLVLGQDPREPFATALNKFGRDGWELVNCQFALQDDNTGALPLCYLKRPLR